ncbi:hypothetical protein JTE90_012104 [Oedothorax gibbosus]|uniref:Uncharacterized protein n=1 Tax=Oedothorax gibbosus TaxID=931172 RepID=A0AAV6UXN6_9ARAC|nr:hypothetical protein JTE90_012104 [Oedothorax gibbosus]
MQKVDPQKAQASNIPPFLKDLLVELSTKCKEPAVFTNVLFAAMSYQSDPLYMVLDLMWYGEGFSRKKHPWMLGKIVAAVKEWCQMYNLSFPITKGIRMKALDVAVDLNDNSVIKQLCEIFNLSKEKEYAKNIIHHMLSTRNFKKAYNLVSALNLEHEYHINEIVFPLFFMGNEEFVKKYLAKVRHYQYEFVKTLDELKRDSQIKEFIRFVNAENLNQIRNILNNKWVMKN